MKACLLAALLACPIASALAKDTRTNDLLIYVASAGTHSAAMEHSARRFVSWMFARVGVRLVWKAGRVPADCAPPNAVILQVEFARHVPLGTGPNALALARPFGDGSAAIAVFYERIQFVAGRQTAEPALLAHVLAHEISHFLQQTDAHSPSGVMKQNWSHSDFVQMLKQPLPFTRGDVEMMQYGLERRRALLQPDPGCVN